MCWDACEGSARGSFSAGLVQAGDHARAGVNLPVYAGFVLAWHAATYYREARDRQLKAAELESLLHQAQLEALRSQLNPHFLFNALHSIAELVHHGSEARRAARSCGWESCCGRCCSRRHARKSRWREELEFIRGYVEIEQMRLGERLRVTWDIEPEALSSRSVPSLILQPLVENAIQHGIAAARRARHAHASRARRDGRLPATSKSRDNGPGLARAARDTPQGIGLANTRARLQRLYGERQGFELHAAAMDSSVSLRIPAAGA